VCMKGPLSLEKRDRGWVLALRPWDHAVRRSNSFFESLFPNRIMSLVRLMRHPFPTRVEAFVARPSWADLASRISKIFDIQLENVAVAYVDEANETFVVTNELALLEYYDSISEAVKIKFVVVDVKQHDSEFVIYSAPTCPSILNQPQPQSPLPGHRNRICRISPVSTRQSAA